VSTALEQFTYLDPPPLMLSLPARLSGIRLTECTIMRIDFSVLAIAGQCQPLKIINNNTWKKSIVRIPVLLDSERPNLRLLDQFQER
jgi:hypothetical protein